jgi:hypothetical protein
MPWERTSPASVSPVAIKPRPRTSEREARATPTKHAAGRPWLALGLAITALCLAAIGGIGSSKRAAATYSWPPRNLQSAHTPSRFWYTPLLLTRGAAAAINVTVSCSLGPPLDASASRTLVLATMRHPVAGGGLAIVKQGSELAFKLGAATFATAPMERAAAGCHDTVLDVTGDRWTLHPPSGLAKAGDFGGATPRVTSLFSGIDLRAGSGPQVRVTTLPYGARVDWWQWPAWLGAIALALGAFVAAFGRPRRRPRPWGGLRRVTQHLHPVDGLVVAVLAVWWVVGPVLYDDGWVKVRQSNGLGASGFSNYYTAYGTNLPLDFWSEWLQHWVVAHSTVILVLRLPALALLLATWIVCRSLFTNLIADTPSSAAVWALGIAFLLNATSWGVTLRPEPIVALLLVAVLALAVGFADRPSGWRLAAAGVLIALAIATHPAGLIVLAPLLAIGPRVISWTRSRRRAEVACLGAALSAVLIVLLTLGSNASERATEARLIRQSGDANASWHAELLRYMFAGTEGTVLRRASLALMLAALVWYAARRVNRPRLDVASKSLAVALILLIPTPSKWAWHFGALIGLAALAVGAEIARFRADGATSRWPVRPLAAYCVTALIIGYALAHRVDWSTGWGLRTLSWKFGFEHRITLMQLALVALALIVGAAVLVGFMRSGREGAWRAPWKLVPLIVPLVTLPFLAWTIGMFIADTHHTHGWTLTRQNVESLGGDAGCGLADDTLVADPTSIRALEAVGSPGTPTRLPWFRVPAGERAGFYVANQLDRTDSLSARWATSTRAGFRASAWVPVSPSGFEVLRHRQSIPRPFVPQGALPSRPAGADSVQLASPIRPQRSLAATRVVGYRDAKLSSLLRKPGTTALMWPDMVLYMPCGRLPRLSGGVVQVPTLLVAHLDLIAVERPTGAFHGLSDLYGFRDLGVADSKVNPNGMTVLLVDRRIPGAEVTPAVRTSA